MRWLEIRDRARAKFLILIRKIRLGRLIDEEQKKYARFSLNLSEPWLTPF